MPEQKPDAKTTPLQLVLQKRDQRWVFRYQPGEESDVLRSLAVAAGDTTKDFDWFDAAVLSHQMGGNMHEQLKKIMGESE